MVMLIEGRKMDLRVSTMSGIFGENIVLRILDRNKLLIGLDKLGFSPSNLRTFTDIILKSYGIVLVTGPTGSGKTTTLYSALSYVNSMEKNIMTLEDPVEYEVPEIFQSQVNLKAGLDFATGLKALLRQDPDIILVGEMRDAETIEAAIRAAITGHLVFSTLHTNDATGAIARLYDMGVEANLLASALLAVVAQRLVRVICHHCKEKVSPEKDLLDSLKLDSKYKDMDFYKGKGCEQCFGTGYKGRIGISEILSIDSSINSLITQRVDSQTLKKRALENGMITMLEDGLQKASDGVTTIEEIKRVAYV
jgi:type IV pilus assembly protein PilB